ncbi:YbaB/EbfC family nucleoid-associated protein [Streptomyces sp. H27-D2]|uniref:YbaB/EbfC family nucleoid-associated protein n=1 Tax=Streptomyces sp. H27-D2 TaxID=3046304 RepID=UPI002DBB299A|nr:YbaB/EbfC family nucleoid-associated protein [Streptomyces sp. H27-D2]MEC4020217.1 YbaB/EbfC family nucleoid-associated protein [Streptomyces sp. H27-D2]
MASLSEQLEEAMAELAEHTQKITQVQEELSRITASATSKDRMVTAVVNPQGEITSLKFHTEAYRTMAPAQLSAVLVTTVNAARVAMTAKVSGSVRPLMGDQDAMADSLFGGGSLDQLLAPLRAMRPQGLAETVLGEKPKAARARADEEQFDG